MERAEIMFLSEKLPHVGENADQFLADPFGFSVCYGRYGVRAKKNNVHWCTECGAEFPLSEVKDYRINPEYKTDKYGFPTATRWKYIGTCPHCGRPMMIESWQYKERTFKDVVAVPATMGDWNLTRYFAITTHCKPSNKQHIFIEDIGATWQREKNTYHYVACKGGMFYGRWWKSDTRHFAQGMEDAEMTCEYTEHYDIPVFNIEDEMAKRHIDLNNLHGMKITRLITAMQDIPHYETLWKQGHWDIAKHFGNSLPMYWSQIKIALRHGYELNSKNIDEWHDMVKMLRQCGKDDHSPKYLCPADLNLAHQALIKQKDKVDWETEFNRIGQKKCDAYEERIERYLDLDIHDEDITIRVLPTIKDFFDEGRRLGHCVFRCAYYDKANSLLLSARQGGKRWETIEVDLVRFKILQCYGYGDKHTERHDEIIDLVKKNMWQIKERRLRKREDTEEKKVAVVAA